MNQKIIILLMILSIGMQLSGMEQEKRTPDKQAQDKNKRMRAEQSQPINRQDSLISDDEITTIEYSVDEMEQDLPAQEGEGLSFTQRLLNLETQAASSASKLDRILQFLETEHQAPRGPLSPAAPKLLLQEQLPQRVSRSAESRVETLHPHHLIARGLQHYRGRGIPVNYNLARHYFETAEKQNLNKQAQSVARVLLGEMYLRGQGVSANYNEARRYFELAIHQNFSKNAQARAWVWLGIMHVRGQGYPENYNEARRYFELAANQDSNAWVRAESWDWLGVIYCSGQGSLVNYSEARTYFELASNQDVNKIAQVRGWLHLAQMYYQGAGILTNYNEAQRYFQLASNQTVHIETRNQAKKWLATMNSHNEQNER